MDVAEIISEGRRELPVSYEHNDAWRNLERLSIEIGKHWIDDIDAVEAVKDVIPLPAKHAKVRLDLQQDKPRPVPKRFKRDDQQALADSLSDHFIPAYELEVGAPISYLSAGHSPEILVKLRRGHWPVQAVIDLHGMISDDARLYISTFISDCKSRGIRCVRIVHGKGLSSHNQEPVLKNKLRGWLMQKNEIIAYVEAKRQDGGSGAVIVLIKA